MTDNRYRPRSPPGSRRYHDPRASTPMFMSSSYDPRYPPEPPRSAVEPHPQSRHASIYDTQPVKRYTYRDDSYPGGNISRTEYAVRPRTNSVIPSDTSRRPLSMSSKNSSPPRYRPLVSNPPRDDFRAPAPVPYPSREDTTRYLVPASSHGKDHHQRHYSANKADQDRLAVASRGSRPRSEYHHGGGYSSKAYTNGRSIKDDDFSYTGPREQFARDYPPRPAPPRESYPRRERPLSTLDLPDHKPSVSERRDILGPPPSSRHHDRLERPDGARSTLRPVVDVEKEKPSDLAQRRHSMRQPVVHQHRDEGYASARDEFDSRSAPKARRERLVEDESRTKPRPKDMDRDLDPERDYSREREKPRERERERERDREHDRDRERERDRDKDKERDREKERDRDRDRDRERIRPSERSGKHSDERRDDRSAEPSPERAGMGKGVATGLAGAAVGGLAGAAMKSRKPDDASDSDDRKEHRHRRHKHRDRSDAGLDPRDPEASQDRRPSSYKDESIYDDRGYGGSRRDESNSESFEDDHGRRHHRRRRHRETGEDEMGPSDASRSGRAAAEPEDDGKQRRRHEGAAPRSRAPEGLEPIHPTISPGEDEDDRPRRVQLVEPVKEKEEFKPKGILKKPRETPFPEDPNPTREGVAPLKDAASKEGIPTGARWTKISRMLVNPEALAKAQERFEEREDYVIVLRVVTREEIQKLAEITRTIREEREREWKEELEKRRAGRGGDHRREDDDDYLSSDNGHPTPRAALDMKPADPQLDVNALTNPEYSMPSAPAPAQAPAPIPVPDIKLEHVDASKYSDEV